MPPGNYLHLGLETGLKKLIIKHFPDRAPPEIVKLQFNVDGIPLFKSTGDQFWPILCCASNISDEVFVVGINHGSSKPECPQQYLKEFLTELNKLTREGIEIQGQKCVVTPEAFICDGPAQSFLL